MSDHSLAFVPVGAGYIQAADVLARGRHVDTGLLAESLVYYDRILVNVENPHQFAELIAWLVSHGLALDTITSLFSNGIFQVCDFAFTTNPYTEFQGESVQIRELVHIQDERMAKPNSFSERYLEFEALRKIFNGNAQFESFVTALENRIIEIKADEVGSPPIKNAYSDFLNPRRNALIAQEFVNEIFRIKSLGPAPKIEVSVTSLDDGRSQIAWNIPLHLLPAIDAETNINAAVTIPLSMAVQVNKYLWVANRQRCDLFLSRPISATVGDKLFEAAANAPNLRIKNVIGELQAKVEFPDLRRYVNAEIIDFNRVLEIRRKAERFRKWLQTEAGREGDVMVAYLNELAKEAGFRNVGRRLLKVFGVLGSAALGSALASDEQLGPSVEIDSETFLEAAAESAATYLSDISSDLGTEWRPVIFGEWYSRKIAALLKKE